MNTDARSAELAPAPVLHGGLARGNGHRSALRGTPGNAQCPAGRSQVMKPKPQEQPLAEDAGLTLGRVLRQAGGD
jgi:hypothetical protein